MIYHVYRVQCRPARRVSWKPGAAEVTCSPTEPFVPFWITQTRHAKHMWKGRRRIAGAMTEAAWRPYGAGSPSNRAISHRNRLWVIMSNQAVQRKTTKADLGWQRGEAEGLKENKRTGDSKKKKEKGTASGRTEIAVGKKEGTEMGRWLERRAEGMWSALITAD